MAIQPPFLYNAVGRDFNEFDPHTKASLAPKPYSRPNHEGPLVNSTRNGFLSSSPARDSFASIPKSQFDKHPDSYTIVPYGNTNAKAMKPSTKVLVTRIRIVQLFLRCLELLGSLGLLVITILISKISSKTSLIIRIPPAVAIIHTTYGIYHLARRPSGRTPASSASYMLFAACFDISLIPFYVFTAGLSEWQYNISESSTVRSDEWSTLLPGGRSLLPKFSETAFLLAAVTGGMHLISLIISIWLAVIFRKITRLPPDMNPLEENLTSRHKKNKHSAANSLASELRLSEPLESKRSSGAAYENLLRPPTLPFHQQNGSVDSFSTYHSTPPPSRGSQAQSPSKDLPPRHYQIPSPRSSLGSQTKNTSTQDLSSSSPKRSSYTTIPLYDHYLDLENIYPTKSPLSSGVKQKDAWFGSDSLSKSRKPAYEPIAQQSFDDFEFSFPNTSSHPSNSSSNYPHHQINPSPPRQSHKIPPSQTHPYSRHQDRQPRAAPSALSERHSNRESIDISTRELTKIREESRDYSSLKSAKVNSSANSSRNNKGAGNDGLKSKYYGDLKPGTPPIMVGAKRQISTGTDVQESFRMLDRRQREVSGKVVEEGRGGGWGERFRRVSGRA